MPVDTKTVGSNGRRTKTGRGSFDEEVNLGRRLVRGVIAGDSASLRKIYELYSKQVYNHCLRITGNPDDAAELTQDTFCNFLRQVKKIDDVDGIVLACYLMATARNTSFNWIKRRERIDLKDEVDEPDDSTELEIDPERSLLQHGQNTSVINAIRRLSHQQRLALLMRETESLSYAEIGKQLKMNENAVAQLLSRARLRLKAEMRTESVSWPSEGAECESALGLLSKRVDQTISSSEDDWLEQHIQACDGCKENLSSIEEAGVSYRSLLPLPYVLEKWIVTNADAAVLLASIGSTAGPSAEAEVADDAARAIKEEKGFISRNRVKIGGAVAVVVLLVLFAAFLSRSDKSPPAEKPAQSPISSNEVASAHQASAISSFNISLGGGETGGDSGEDQGSESVSDSESDVPSTESSSTSKSSSGSKGSSKSSGSKTGDSGTSKDSRPAPTEESDSEFDGEGTGDGGGGTGGGGGGTGDSGGSGDSEDPGSGEKPGSGPPIDPP